MQLLQNSAGLATPEARRPGKWARWGSNLCFVIIEMAGWLSIHTLAILGCAVAAFLVLSGGNLGNFFLHLENLSSRFADADAGRRAAFEQQVVLTFLVLYVGALILRAPRFVKRLRREIARASEGAQDER